MNQNEDFDYTKYWMSKGEGWSEDVIQNDENNNSGHKDTPLLGT